jgi:hemolysin activation/secretion protein
MLFSHFFQFKVNLNLLNFNLILFIFLLINSNLEAHSQISPEQPSDGWHLLDFTRPISPDFSDFEIIPEPIPSPADILPPASEAEINPVIPDGSIKVIAINFTGNQIFSAEKLAKIEIDLDSGQGKRTAISAIKNTDLSFFQLNQIATEVANFYHHHGYKTSGAIIDLGETLPSPDKPVIVTVKVQEGKLEKIQIQLIEKKQSQSSAEEQIRKSKKGRLADYILSRLHVKQDYPLNVTQLLAFLQLLQLDPLIDEISATLSTGTQPHNSILVVEYHPSNFLKTMINVDNSRSPSIGTVQRGIILEGRNLLGLGDIVTTNYYNSDGSHNIDFSYKLPVNSHNTTVRFDYSWTDNQVIETPFYDINQDGKTPDITSNSQNYGLTLRQPIIRKINNETQTLQEVALGLTGSWRKSQSYLLDSPFPLSPGADELGITKVFALRFFQEFTRQKPRQLFAFRSQLNLGINAFNSSINQPIVGVEKIPDSEFFYWQGQAQYSLLFAQDKLLLLRGNLQLASQPLLPMEQFATGGFGSVRGYRQDQLLTDNGLFLSVEVLLPLFKINNWHSEVDLIPFFDYGTTWNTGRASPENQTLSSVGLGLQWRITDLFKARLDYGIPLVNIESRQRTLQEHGLSFTVQFLLN